MQLLSNGTYEFTTYAEKAALREVAVTFFYWWHNQPGSNTADAFDDWLKLQARCVDCGARTPEEAETKCICSGDKDYCHGQTLWPE